MSTFKNLERKNKMMTATKSIIEFNPKDKAITIKGEVIRLQEAIKDKILSEETAWKSFWLSGRVAKLGSSDFKVRILSESGYSDQEIISFLISANFPSKQIVRILNSAGWGIERISLGVKNFFINNQQTNEINNDIIDFFMFCGWDHVEFIKALIITNCFINQSVKILLENNWDNKQIADSVIKSGLMNKSVLGLLIPIPNFDYSYIQPLLTIDEFFKVLRKNHFTKERIVELLAGSLKNSLDCIMVLSEFNFKLDFICLNLIKSGYSIKEIINSIYKTWVVDYPEKLSQVEILIKRGRIIKLMKRMKLSEQIIFRELHDMEWTILMIIESMVMAQISKRVIVKAFFEAEFSFLSSVMSGKKIKLYPVNMNLTEYYIMKAINDGQRDFNNGGNCYWNHHVVKEWKLLVSSTLK